MPRESTEKGRFANVSQTTHPNLMLRLPVFTPINSRTVRKGLSANDITECTRSLEIVSREGYDSVKIMGIPLDAGTDFRVWCAILIALHRSEDGNAIDEVSLSFKEFAALCGYPTRRFDAALRGQLDASLFRIASQLVSFTKTPKGSQSPTKSFVTHLVHSSRYNAEDDTIKFKIENRLWELYRIDFTTVVKTKLLDLYPRNQTIRCLIMYLLALPQKARIVSFSRIAERLDTKCSVKESNRMIKRALDELMKIGFLRGSIASKGTGRSTKYSLVIAEVRSDLSANDVPYLGD